MHAEESGHRGVHARHFQRDETIQCGRFARAAVTCVGEAGNIEGRHLRDEFEGEFGSNPIAGDDRRDLRFHKRPHPGYELGVLWVQH